MTRWWIVLSSVASVALAISSSFAADLSPARAPAAAVAEPVEHGNVYVGVDVAAHGNLAAYAGVLYAPWGMDRSGLRLSVFGLPGRYDYTSDDLGKVKGVFTSADVLVGWSQVFENGAVTVQGGVNYQNHSLSPNDPFNVGRGGYDFFNAAFWLGPEVAVTGNQRSDELRIGAAVTGVKVGPASLTLSGGWLDSRDDG